MQKAHLTQTESRSLFNVANLLVLHIVGQTENLEKGKHLCSLLWQADRCWSGLSSVTHVFWKTQTPLLLPKSQTSHD